MRTCKVKPHHNDCCVCLDMQMEAKVVQDCATCVHNEEYDLLEILNSFWGTFALVQKNGQLSKVPIDRVYDIRERR